MTKKKTFTDPEGHCIVTGFRGVVLHHLYSRGAHGEINEEWNLMPLTVIMHTEVHWSGLVQFIKKHPQVETWLLQKGWYFEKLSKKWRHPRMLKESSEKY